MNFYETVKARRSVRNFKTAPVESEKLTRIWEAVRWAPSACNNQPWRFLVVNSPDARARLRLGLTQEWAFRAPVLVVALGNRRTAWERDGESIHAVDVAIAVEHLVLAAAAEGLGTCWVCAFDRKKVAAALALAPEWEPVAIIPIGYPNDPLPRTDRKPLRQILQEV